MTTLPYTYEIVSVGDLSMDVRYDNPDHDSIVVGVRLPNEGETVDEVVAQFSPAHLWHERVRPKLPVTSGTTGAGQTEVEPEPPDLTPEEELQFWRQNMAISQFQAHHMLQVWGLYDQAVALVAGIGNPVELGFNRAIEWRRASPTIISLFDNLVLADSTAPTPEDVDLFFTQAKAVEL